MNNEYPKGKSTTQGVTICIANKVLGDKKMHAEGTPDKARPTDQRKREVDRALTEGFRPLGIPAVAAAAKIAAGSRDVGSRQRMPEEGKVQGRLADAKNTVEGGYVSSSKKLSKR